MQPLHIAPPSTKLESRLRHQLQRPAPSTVTNTFLYYVLTPYFDSNWLALEFLESILRFVPPFRPMAVYERMI